MCTLEATYFYEMFPFKYILRLFDMNSKFFIELADMKACFKSKLEGFVSF